MSFYQKEVDRIGRTLNKAVANLQRVTTDALGTIDARNAAMDEMAKRNREDEELVIKATAMRKRVLQALGIA